MIAIANEKFWKKAEKLKNRQVLENILEAIENIEAAQSQQDIRELKRVKRCKSLSHPHRRLSNWHFDR